MKTQLLRVWAVTSAVLGVALCAGCDEERAQAEVPLFTSAPAAQPPAVEVLEKPDAAVEATKAIPAITNAAVVTTNAAPEQLPDVRVVQSPLPPADVQASPALAEIVKLVEAGVSEDVMLAYINNAPESFNVSSDQIVYLSDLGVSAPVLTALLQHGGKPGGGTLPPALALTSPATNIYPPGYAPQALPATATAPAVAEEPNSYVTAPLVPTEAPASPAYFYDSLAPYGSWIDVEGYGRCWQPTVAVANTSWRPYGDRGHWLWSDAGWYWYSDYSWGWAPFHYGRWCSYPRLGWFWVPDTCWGPAWVSWRQTASHCGWAPLPPAAVFVSGKGFFHHGIRVGIGIDFGLSASLYTFVPLGHFQDRSFYNHRVSGSQATVIYRNSTVVNNYIVNHGTVINHGIGVERVTQASGHRIPTVAIQTASATASGNSHFRREQIQNNGSSLTVVRPPLVPAARPTHFSTPDPATPRQGSSATTRNFSGVNTPASPSATVSSPRQNWSPPHGFGNQPVTGAPAISGRDTWAPNQLSRQSRPVEPLHGQTRVASATSTDATTPSQTPTPRAGRPEPGSGLLPPLGQRPPTLAQPPASDRPINGTRPATPSSPAQVYRVYPGSPVAPAPSVPRVDPPATPYTRNAPASPSVVVPPSYHADPGRSPAIRSESGHAPASVQAPAHSSPARSSSDASTRSSSSSGSGSKKDKS